MIKLNLGSGSDYMEGWINVDLYTGHTTDERFDVKQLPYQDNSVDEIKAFHIIEHFPWTEGLVAIREWYRVLKPNGRLWLETPDLLESCKEYVNGDEYTRDELIGHFFSEAGDSPGQTHYVLFSETKMKKIMELTGFTTINRIAPSSNYSQLYPANIFLCLEAFK